jgi:hypothetical protein
MANDCWNKAVITGSNETLQKIKTRFESSENGVFNMNNYHTLFDSDVSDMTEEEFGSKRFTPSVEIYDNQLVISGDSAWSPMIGLFERICVDYGVEATLEYDEIGYDFAGKIVWDSKGVELVNEEFTYWEWMCIKDPDSFWEEMSWRYEDYDTFEELLETFELHKWKDQSVLDTTKLKEQYQSAIDN